MSCSEKLVGGLVHKVLYKKRRNRYLKEQWDMRGALKHMTLMFGARCIDGVVLVSDRLVKSGENTAYTDKIRKVGNIPWAIFGAAGLGTLFEEFLNRLPETVNRTMAWMNFQNAKNEKERQELFKDNPDAPRLLLYVYSVENFKHDCVALLTDMMRRYDFAFENSDDCLLQILIGVSTGSEAKLYYLDSINCLPAEVLDADFIGQREKVKVFQKCWNASMTMQTSAKLGAFTIKYVELDEISDTVGVGIGGSPQIWFIPDGSLPMEITGSNLTALMQDVNGKANSLLHQLHNLFGS